MFAVSHGKIVATGEIFFRTHVEIIVVSVVKHRIDTRQRRDANGARGQTGLLISIVWALHLEMLMHDATQTEISEGELDRGISLQRHFFVQTVEIHRRHHWFFGIVGRFLFHNGGYRDYLVGREAVSLRFGQTLGRPERFAFFIHSSQQCRGRKRPIHLVGVGQKETNSRFGRLAVERQQFGIGQRGIKRVGRSMQFASQEIGQIACCAQNWNRESSRRLVSVAQIAKYAQNAGAGTHIVTTGADMLPIVENRSQQIKSGVSREMTFTAHFVINRIDRVVAVNVNNALAAPV